MVYVREIIPALILFTSQVKTVSVEFYSFYFFQFVSYNLSVPFNNLILFCVQFTPRFSCDNNMSR